MRYFHRTAASLDEVLREADRYFPPRAASQDSGEHHRVYGGAVGRITVDVHAEGGHYTLVAVETDQVGESEADKIAKRFLTRVHQLTDPSHVARGAY